MAAPKGYGKGGKGAAPGRKVIAAKKYKGTLVEWKGSTGWIKSEEAIKHPDANRNGGRIFVHRNDIQAAQPSVGMVVEFIVYSDNKGLGAQDVRETSGKPPLPAATPAATGARKPPPGWELQWSEEHKEHFYWNKATKQSSWTHPDGEEELPLGWSKEYDKENDMYYYWHKPSKTASWEPPKGAGGQVNEQNMAESEEPAAPGMVKKAKKVVLGKTRIQGVVTKWHGFFGWVTPLQELGADLQPALERSSNKIYINWRDVEGGAKLKIGSHINFKLSLDSTSLLASAARLHIEGDDEDDEAEEEQANGTADQATGGAEATEGEEASDLLPGWTEQYSDEHQCPYYWHAATQQASWERPSVPEDDEDEAEDEDQDEELAKPATTVPPRNGTQTVGFKGKNGKGAAKPVSSQPPNKKARFA